MKLRVGLEPWRWLILSGLGCGSLQGCGGEATTSDATDDGVTSSGQNVGGSGTGGASTMSSGTSASTDTDSSSDGSSSTGSGGGSTSTNGGSSATGTDTASVGGASTSASAATTGGPEPRPCNNPTDLGGNWERCDDGTVHRPEPGVCPNLLPAPAPAPLSEVDECATDADCTAAPLGYCVAAGGEIAANVCRYGCESDADCDSESICMCGDPIGTCVPASCVSDEDCGDGLRCTDYDSSGGCDVRAFACETPDDLCVTNADCDGDLCAFQNGRRECTSWGCAIGRPFLVRGEKRVAELVLDSSWGERAGAAVAADARGPLSADEAAAVAQRWTQAGLMEHASIAAFARFALQLLHVGAPPNLIEATQQAMADETRHARICFAMAARYSGSPKGPGALSLDAALEGSELRSIVRTTVLEGCIGETVAAVEAAEAAEHAASSELKNVLVGIAEDERRHAQLAWSFVAWAIERDASLVADVRALLRSSLDEQDDFSDKAQSSPQDAALLCHGHLPAAHRAHLRQQVLQQVVLPAGDALLSKRCRGKAKALSKAESALGVT